MSGRIQTENYGFKVMAIQLVVGQGVTHNRQAHDYIRHRMRKDHTATGPVAGSMRLAEVRLAAAAGQSGRKEPPRKVWVSRSRRTRRW